MTVLIPAYEPDTRLVDLVFRLQAEGGHRVVVVDDGSGEAFRPIFGAVADSGCTVLTHAANRGKGRALKTGFRYLQSIGATDGVVCADSDGQHSPADIGRVARHVSEDGREIVLGVRRFAGKVPLRSRFGNAVTRLIYRASTGVAVADTQTGLRGFSARMLDWLCRIPGERFEYEMNMLLAAPAADVAIREETIETIYLDNNRSSHFRPLADSVKIYWPIVKFSASSLLSALIDFVLLLLIPLATPSLFIAVAGARLCSSVFNYTMNRNYVFGGNKKAALRRSMPRYFALVAVILLLNYGLMYVLHNQAGLPLAAAKVLTEGSLFLLSFAAQRAFVY